MSSLRTANGDDHPEAARKHLLDAQVLLGQQRADGAAYLSGYVVECALKSLWLHETGLPMGRMPWGTKHAIGFLASHVGSFANVAGAKTSRYYKQATSSVAASAIAGWGPGMRYRPETMTHGDAQTWLQIAQNVFQETVAQMQLDGVL
jgi:HEPN domain-containing protein